jgi:hypothetical protein
MQGTWTKDIVVPCNPSPCGPNGRCRHVNGAAVCSYPECVLNSDCPFNKACFNQKCQNPCTDSCGVDAICNVINHQAVCVCPQGFVGSPFVRCSKLADEPLFTPECTSDNDCSKDKSCINQKCVNPCTIGDNICAQNAECRVQYHRAICSCHAGFTGNPQSSCYESKCILLLYLNCIYLKLYLFTLQLGVAPMVTVHLQRHVLIVNA